MMWHETIVGRALACAGLYLRFGFSPVDSIYARQLADRKLCASQSSMSLSFVGLNPQVLPRHGNAE